jgi:hypothetical protein
VVVAGDNERIAADSVVDFVALGVGQDSAETDRVQELVVEVGIVVGRFPVVEIGSSNFGCEVA